MTTIIILSKLLQVNQNNYIWILAIVLAACCILPMLIMRGRRKNNPGNPGNKGYYCPMHPEETSDKPGKCPKCGMDLVSK